MTSTGNMQLSGPLGPQPTLYIFLMMWWQGNGILFWFMFLAVRVFANGPGDLGSIPGRVIPKTQKMVLDASLLNTQHYKVQIKGKVEQSREGVVPSPTPWCSSYRKGSLRDYPWLWLLTLLYYVFLKYFLNWHSYFCCFSWFTLCPLLGVCCLQYLYLPKPLHHFQDVAQGQFLSRI